MRLQELGWNASFEAAFAEFREAGLESGRVAVEDKHHYLVFTASGELSAQVAGKVLHRAASTAELPKVGDWVTMLLLPAEKKGVIQHILPRQTALSRKTPGRDLDEQILAANVDVIFSVQSLDRFNPRLLERQLVMAHESGARPVVILNKADLETDTSEKLAEASHAAGQVPVIVTSAKTGRAIDALREYLRAGITAVFIGPSGVGKSSLINRLYGKEIQATIEVRERDSKGRHTTAWRELIVLPQGGVVIDTPGLRELDLWRTEEGMRGTFADIEEFAAHCRFRDCTHINEKDCGVKAALAEGRLPEDRYQSYLKLQRETACLEQAQQQRGWAERRRRDRIAPRAFNKTKR